METLIAERARGAILNFMTWRFRFKRSVAHDAVYVASYTQRADAPGTWTYGTFWATSNQTFESFRAHFANAEFFEVGYDDLLIQ